MPDDLLEDLGNYFVAMHVGARFGVTFQQFVERYMTGRWTKSFVIIPFPGGAGFETKAQ